MEMEAVDTYFIYNIVHVCLTDSMFGNYQMWSSFWTLWTSELDAANEDQEWSWLTQAQMAQWHQEDEKWLKARAAEAVAADRRYYSVDGVMERLMAQTRELARAQLQLEATRTELARRRCPAGPAMD